MRFLISILLSLIVGGMNIFAQTDNEKLVQAKLIVDGLFFDNPKLMKSLLPGGASIIPIKDEEKNMIMGIYLPEGFVLDDSIKAKAIPAERVKYSDKLLRDYNGRRPQNLGVYEGIGVKEGEPFVKFEYRDIDNNVWNNEKLKGKIFVINLWQTECGPCRREMPILSTWKEKFPDVVFLSASRHNREEILPIAEKHNFTWTHLQEASDLVALVRKEGFPLTIVVDKEGIVRFAKVGASPKNQAEAVAVIEELSNL
ncbi:MAG: TlpA family protein disulfide reductase [Muribaculaceae bacterium]|nr:TlpA family protein disulfide reductase [Muribaculaceae bacterium]